MTPPATPSFLEKWTELIGVGVAAVAIVIGAAVTACQAQDARQFALDEAKSNLYGSYVASADRLINARWQVGLCGTPKDAQDAFKVYGEANANYRDQYLRVLVAGDEAVGAAVEAVEAPLNATTFSMYVDEAGEETPGCSSMGKEKTINLAAECLLTATRAGMAMELRGGEFSNSYNRTIGEQKQSCLDAVREIPSLST